MVVSAYGKTVSVIFPSTNAENCNGGLTNFYFVSGCFTFNSTFCHCEKTSFKAFSCGVGCRVSIYCIVL